MTRSILTVAAFLGCISAQLSGATITSLSENFDELSQGLAVTSAGAFSTIGGTNVDIVGSTYSLCNGPESGNCIDMNGTGGNPQGQLESNSEFAAGTYDLSFDLIGSQRSVTASVTVTLGNYDQMFTLGPSDFTDGVVSDAVVTVTTPGYLLFSSDITGDYGLLLDNVVVSPANLSGVPEPSSLWLLGTALLAEVIVIARRRRALA